MHFGLGFTLAEIATMESVNPEELRSFLPESRFWQIPIDSLPGPALVISPSDEQELVQRALETWTNGLGWKPKAMASQMAYAVLLAIILFPVTIWTLFGLHAMSVSEPPSLAAWKREEPPQTGAQSRGSPNLADVSHQSAEAEGDGARDTTPSHRPKPRVVPSAKSQKPRPLPPLEDGEPSFERATQLARRGQWRAAATMYAKLQEGISGSQLQRAAVAEARIRLQRLNEPSTARSVYQKALQANPSSSRAAEALLGLGDAHAALGRKAKAREAWVETARRFSGSVAGQKAAQRLATP